MGGLEALREQVNEWMHRKILGKTALSRGHIERITREVTETAKGLEGKAREMLTKFGVVNPDDSAIEHAMRMIIGNAGLDVFEPIPGLNTDGGTTDATGRLDETGARPPGDDTGERGGGSGQAGPTPGGESDRPGQNGTPDGTRGGKSRRAARQAGTATG